jgi:signal transduction histidine kinase
MLKTPSELFSVRDGSDVVEQEHIGLFDTPPGRTEYWLAIAIVTLLLAGLILVLPVRSVEVGEVAAFIPVVESMMFMGELIIATLLYSQARLFRSRPLAFLATGYVFIAFLLIPHALTFPGAFSENGLLGAGVNSTGWLAAVRRISFPVIVALYVLFDRPRSSRQAGFDLTPGLVWITVAAAICLAAGVTALVTLGHGLLPSLFVDRSRVVPATLLALGLIAITLTLLSLVLLFRRRRSLLDLWLIVSLVGWLFQSLLNLTLMARFTVGWYSLYLLMFVSSLTIMIALIADSNRLHESLARSTAARNREREDRLMSMDVMASAMSHEAGQPLSAAMLNMSAGLNWLDRPQPNVKKAADSIREAIEAVRRTFDAIKSLKVTPGNQPGIVQEFDLNNLLREAVASMKREFSRMKTSVDLDLDSSRLLVRGDPVQIRRVVVNLLSNALDALRTTRPEFRRVIVRTTRPNEREVLLQISDTGAGISPENHELIFEQFFTTKKGGLGLGLWLCRSVVENHAGRLWATNAPGGGATFHLQMPGSIVIR